MTPQSATFELTVDAERAVLMVTGEIDLVTAPDFREQLNLALQASHDVVVDMSGVTFFCSAGVDALASITTPSGTTVTLVDPTPETRRALDILGWPKNLRLSAGALHA